MKTTISPGPRVGRVEVPCSKSQAHRLLICAALGEAPVSVVCGGLSGDIRATAACLNALGAEIAETDGGTLNVTPIPAVPAGQRILPCGESGSTLRFLLPLTGALGAEAVFRREGRLPDRPLAPLDQVLSDHGMTLQSRGADLYCAGRLIPGDYVIRGDVSSQYVSGLLMSLPLLPGGSTLSVTGKRESEAYITMTEDALRLGGIAFEKRESVYIISGNQRPRLPGTLQVEGDWSSAAFFLCMGAFSRGGITVTGMNMTSSQGDRRVLDILRDLGARVEETPEGVTVRRGELRGCVIDAAQTPDLIPALCAVAAAASGETRIINGGRLRLKESDRIESTVSMLRGLGARVEELPEGMVIWGKPSLPGGEVNPQGDHRIAMAAAVAAAACEGAVTVRQCQCVEKSYPRFWEDLAALRGETA